MQPPVIIQLKERKLIGMRISTSFAEDKTLELWQAFKKRVGEIENRSGNDFYSVQVYDKSMGFSKLQPTTTFEKWAAVEVSEVSHIPSGMHQHIILSGEYAVFTHKGPVSEFHKTAEYIFNSWLPSSGYALDDRDHFEILGDKYLGTMHPDSEEEVWIPVRIK